MYAIERSGVLRSKVPVAVAVVPDLHAMTENDARVSANTAHVGLFVASREPVADAKPGSVLRQSIPAGQHVPLESAVTVVLADEVVKVPAVLELPIAEATKRLEERGYLVQVGATTPDPFVPQGAVLGQMPKAGAVYTKGSVVTVQVSAGTGDIQLPKLLGVAVADAKSQLEKLGVKPVVRWVAMAETPTNVVLSQKPAAGEKVKSGAEVQLTVCSR